MQFRPLPEVLRRYGHAALGVTCAAAILGGLAPVRADDSRATQGATESLSALTPHELEAGLFSKVKLLLVKPRGAAIWPMQDFAIAAGGLDSDPHAADVLITLASAAVGQTTVELVGGGGERRPALLRVGGAVVTAGHGPVTLTADSRGQIRGVLISSDMLNAVVIRAGGKLSQQIRFQWDDNTAADAWVSRPLSPVPGAQLTETVTLKHAGMPLDGHRLHFFVKRVEVEDDDGRRTTQEFTPAHPGDAYATFDAAEYCTNSEGTVRATLTVKDRPEVVDIVRSYRDESVFLTDMSGRVLPAAAPQTPRAAATPGGRTTEVIQRLKRYGSLLAAAPVAEADPQAAALRDALLGHVAAHPEEREALAYYIAELNGRAGQREPARTWALAAAKDVAHCAEARRVLLENGGTWEGGPSAGHAGEEALLRALAEVYPKGREADALTLRAIADPARRAALARVLVCDPFRAQRAGDLYQSMGMMAEAVGAYRLSVGLMEERFSREAAVVWMEMGDCFAAQGNAPAALSCFYKSLASGQPLQDITHRIREARAGLTAAPPAKVPANPDPDTLDQIARLLADSALYEDALVAARAAQEFRGQPSALLAEMEQRQSAFLNNVLRIAGGAVMVRGVNATTDH